LSSGGGPTKIARAAMTMIIPVPKTTSRHAPSGYRYVEQSAAIVDRLPQKVVVLGIRPDRPEPGYDYITLVATRA
jgi:hypothetical protein